MRKWMRDRLKRKKPEAGKGEPGPAPLQPAYFDAAPGAPAVEENSQKSNELKSELSEVYDARRAEEPAGCPASCNRQFHPASSQVEKTGGPGEPRRRRRRGRGGRGRGGSRSAVAAPSAGASTESAPEGDAEAPVPPAGGRLPPQRCRVYPGAASFWLSDCLGRARVRGSSATRSRRFRATFCGACSLTILPNNDFRI